MIESNAMFRFPQISRFVDEDRPPIAAVKRDRLPLRSDGGLKRP